MLNPKKNSCTFPIMFQCTSRFKFQIINVQAEVKGCLTKYVNPSLRIGHVLVYRINYIEIVTNEYGYEKEAKVVKCLIGHWLLSVTANPI